MTFAALLFTFSWNVVSGQSMTTPVSSTVLKKCCPEGQTFSTQQLGCQDLVYDDPQLAQHDTLKPALLSDLSGITNDSMRMDYVLETGSVGNDAIPRCDNITQQLTYLLHAGNDPNKAEYAILDLQNKKNRRPFWLVDLSEKEAYQDYCVDTGHSEATFYGTVAVYCKTRDDIGCMSRPCISYCCDEGYIYDANFTCFRDPSRKYTRVATLVDNDGDPVEVDKSNIREFFGHEPMCEMVHLYLLEEVSILSTGNLQVSGEQLDWNKYCLERFVDQPQSHQSYSSYEEDLPVIALVCAPDKPYETGYLSYQQLVGQKIMPILFIISMIFLGFLFVHVYRKKRQKLFGTMTLCLITMLFCFYVCLIAAKCAGVSFVTEHKFGCLTLGLLIQYFYLSAIFWLNTMSYDIWTAFRHLRSAPEVTQPGTMGWQHKRFKSYAAYSWGCPLIVIIITIIMQSLPDGLVSPEFTPSIGNPRCFLAPKLAMVLYLNVFILPLIMLNIFFFVSSMWNLCCGLWADKGHDEVVRHQNKTKYKTVVKMFFAMGIPWVAESISYAIEWAYGPRQFRYLVTAFEIINSLQGMILFHVIVFDSTTLALIKHKLFGRSNRQPNSQQRSPPHRVGRGAAKASSFTKTPVKRLSSFIPKHQHPNDTTNGIELEGTHNISDAHNEQE